MPRIFDNIAETLLPALLQTLEAALRADFCVGYLNLRGWSKVDGPIDGWTAEDRGPCRVLVGMQRPPEEQVRELHRLDPSQPVSNQEAHKLRQAIAQSFRQQLTFGLPTGADEAGLRRLAHQLRVGAVRVKLFLRHPLHAKLYLLYRDDYNTPCVGYLGSSNLTLAGLRGQGELNIDVVDQDATNKLACWFQDRWDDHFSLDITDELAQIIDESWAGERPIPPYHIYLKIAYHLSREARTSLTQFQIPKPFRGVLFRYQEAAVLLAARHVNQRNGVLLGDVVGLGKTMMAAAVASIFQEDRNWRTLILCPKNLVSMWEWYVYEYHLDAHVLSVTRVQQELPNLRRYNLVVIDESQNLRNPEGKRWAAIREYIERNESRCVLLSATPYNKAYNDLFGQLALFLGREAVLEVRPERLLRELGPVEFSRRYQCLANSLQAFQKSEYADDWRDLMRLYMVRRTRTYIRENYADTDPQTGRQYLVIGDGQRSYFPERIPRKVEFAVDPNNAADTYARMFAPKVEDAINDLALPRYGMSAYQRHHGPLTPTREEAKILEDISQGGPWLRGFCRTNLFKRLESCGHAFILSVKRHILRNYVLLHALEHDLPLPIGPQGAELFDTTMEDADAESVAYDDEGLPDADADQDGDEGLAIENGLPVHPDPAAYRSCAARVYRAYQSRYHDRFRWIRPGLFHEQLAQDLERDVRMLLQVLDQVGVWDPQHDAKLAALEDLVRRQHPHDKVLVFSQFADTVHYLADELQRRGLDRVMGVTGQSSDPTAAAQRFSPLSNEYAEKLLPEDELRVLIATDVLSEGQNLQDAHIVVNFDLPWAIIRLIQRVGRVDRIGQQAERILCYSFLPADGVERIIHLRARLQQRLEENAEVVGTDERFFPEHDAQKLWDLYHEKPGILEGDDEGDVDLVSQAYQIWQQAVERDASLAQRIPSLPDVIYSTKAWNPPNGGPSGALVYLNTQRGSSSLVWLDRNGQVYSESLSEILEAARCEPDTPALERLPEHHDLVAAAAKHLREVNKDHPGGQLGRTTGARYRTYERLRAYLTAQQHTLFAQTSKTRDLAAALEQMLQYPLREVATTKLNRQLRTGITDEGLADLVVGLYRDDDLCVVQPDDLTDDEPSIICSLGLAPTSMDPKETP